VSDKKSVEIRVSVDVGYRRHSVAIGLPPLYGVTLYAIHYTLYRVRSLNLIIYPV
jgi:hypothetical protein